jgi:hypothetical protein
VTETTLHATLKKWYAGDDGLTETSVGAFIVDVLNDDEIIEIQTRNFGALRPKLVALLPDYRIHLVHPIFEIKWIATQTPEKPGEFTRRRSPSRGQAIYILSELLPIVDLIPDANLKIETIHLEVEEMRLADGKGSWRRKGVSIQDRKLLKILGRYPLDYPIGFQNLIPPGLPVPFTFHDFSSAAHLSRARGRKALSCLRRLELIKVVGKKGRAYLYESRSGR